MDNAIHVIVKFANTMLGQVSTCAAIRATAAQFVDVPRGELANILVEHCKLNVATVRTQVQRGREQLDGKTAVQAPRVVSEEASTSTPTASIFAKVNARKGKAKAKPAKAAKAPAKRATRKAAAAK